MIKNYTLEEITERIKSQSLISNKVNKELYGEVYTPLYFVKEILKIIPEETFKNPQYKWLDPGSGTGNFSIILYYKLLIGLETVISDIEERKEHIIKNMIYMIELRSENIEILKHIFGKDANIYEENYLNYKHNSEINDITPQIFDVIIGNPPFNTGGPKKVPTNNKLKKTEDGLTLWMAFVIKSISLLHNNTGQLCLFIPSIWLKPDKKRLYYLLTQYDIKKLNCMSNTKTNKIFKGNAQTPSCYFLLTKCDSSNTINIYDECRKEYIDYYLTPGDPIPVFGQTIIRKLKKYCYLPNNINNTIIVIKSNMPPKSAFISPIKTEKCKYPNVTTCKLKANSNTPELIINYSDIPLAFLGVPKLILAHKMYGFPYLDISGEYGISNRDNYVIIKEKYEDLIKLKRFLSTKTALYLFEATRYRMKYLEKYAFQLIPDITQLPDFPTKINDNTIADYFQFDEEDRYVIQRLHKKTYGFFK